jgi:hypothetical protein
VWWNLIAWCDLLAMGAVATNAAPVVAEAKPAVVNWWPILGLGAVILGLLGIAANSLIRDLRTLRRRRLTERGKRDFLYQRERLEFEFWKRAQAAGIPRGLVWEDCDFEKQVTFVRDRKTKRLRALVGVTIQFSAVPGGGLEGHPNVQLLRAATAVFDYDGKRWSTSGRALFNLDPPHAVERLREEIEAAE